MTAAAAPPALERLRLSMRPRLLFVSHAFGGGVGRHVGELARALADDAEVLGLEPASGGLVTLRWLREGQTLAFHMDPRLDWDALLDLLRALAVARVHFHHVHGLPREVLQLPRQLDCPYDVTLHDYYPVCPAYHLAGGDGRYCRAHAGCLRCDEAGPVQWGLSIAAWRECFHTLLRGAGRIIAPSHDCATRIARFFPDVRPVVWPHPEHAPRTSKAPARVLVPGAISQTKGLDVLEACARDARARDLPLHFRVLGYLSRAMPRWPDLPLTLAGEYPADMVGQLLALERGDVVFFPAQCPETFSYTLSAALDTGLPIVATDLGAFPERLAARANAHLVRWDAPAADINAALLEMAAAPATPALRERMTFAAYRQKYVEGITPRLPYASTAVHAPQRWMQPAPTSGFEWTLAALVEDAIACGRTRSAGELAVMARATDRRIAQQDARVRDLQSLLDERDAESAALRADSARVAARVADVHARLQLLERSRSWRVTAPLRAMTRWLQRVARNREKEQHS